MRPSPIHRFRPIVTAWLLSAALALISAAVTLAGSTGTSYP